LPPRCFEGRGELLRFTKQKRLKAEPPGLSRALGRLELSCGELGIPEDGNPLDSRDRLAQELEQLPT